ncbi:hypothetical protein LOAG_11416 [Loa loa]|uniref:CARMIL_C domain-containing protein n=1 Tax=Loa loa TaxID=7209 RepID=A0A1I7VDC0_LOALO|nr:hypothetical protein LOAG_11416 [Loa loa]EFO17085.1 hypothetical protein LOAG_11416 [Loa loa]
MPRTNVCSEVTISNIRLAVRQVVADFCASPERTVENIMNARFENLVEPIQQLIATRLERIYEQIQYSILSPSNEPPSSRSVLRFLSEHNDESEKDVIQRFEDKTSSRGHIHEQWQKLRIPPPLPINPASPTVIPRLENLSSDHSSRNSTSDKRRKSAKNVQNSNSFPSSKNTSSTTSSTSSNLSLQSGDSLLQPLQESGRNRLKLFLSGRKSSTTSSCNITERPPSHMATNRDANVNDGVLVRIRKAADDALPVVLDEEFVPSVPSLETAIYPTLANEKSKIPTSLCSSLRSDDDKVTVQFFPTKVPTADAAVSTDPAFMDNQSVEKIEVGVNTIIEMGGNLADGSSSSNTTSDNSAGQLPKRLFDTVLQRPSLRIVSLRPDGSIVPTVNSASHHFPSVREWIPVANEENGEKSVLASEAEICDVADESDPDYSGGNGMRLDSVSASISRPDPFEEDLNTLANISPLPHS